MQSQITRSRVRGRHRLIYRNNNRWAASQQMQLLRLPPRNSKVLGTTSRGRLAIAGRSELLDKSFGSALGRRPEKVAFCAPCALSALGVMLVVQSIIGLNARACGVYAGKLVVLLQNTSIPPGGQENEFTGEEIVRLAATACAAQPRVGPFFDPNGYTE